MRITDLVTYSFPKNLGRADRVFRIVSGAGLSVAGWIGGASVTTAIVLSLAGAGWAATGILSRCSIYYLLGYSTCPLRDVDPAGP